MKSFCFIMRNLCLVVAGLTLLFPCVDILAEDVGWQASGANGAVTAGGSEAVQAGIEILKDGGNAADAAAATLLALTVTDGTQFCFGGEVPILVYDAKRHVVEVLSGQGVAPRLATLEYFEKKGGIPAGGPEAAAVPATLDACLTLLDRYGTLTFTEVVTPTLLILEKREKAWHRNLTKTIRRLIQAEEASPSDRRRGLRLVADYFYRGPLARELDEWSRANGGLLRYTDLSTHVTRVEEPVHINYRGYAVYKCGPWTQGPYLLETLRLLEGYDLKGMGHNQPDTIHVMVEAMKLALADRDTYYADPLFEDVPLKELLSKEYADIRRGLINMERASMIQQPGDPQKMRPLLDQMEARRALGGPSSDTTTCIAADRWGNVVCATPSGWGGVVAGETGVVLGTRLQSLNTWKGHPNCIEPGKRPRITLTPTLVLKHGKPAIAVSVAGGDWQDQTTLQLLLNHMEFGLGPAESVTAPRFITEHLIGSFRQPPPELGSLYIYDTVDESTIGELRRRGHHVKIKRPPISQPCMMIFDPESGVVRVAGDPKAGRHAAAF